MNINAIQSMIGGATGLSKAQVEETLKGQEIQGFQSAIEKAVSSKDNEALKKATEEFEAVFIQQLLKSMRATVPKSDLFEKSHGREVFEGMYDEELSKTMASTRQFGIADLLYNQLSAFSETKKPGLDLKG